MRKLTLTELNKVSGALAFNYRGNRVFMNTAGKRSECVEALETNAVAILSAFERQPKSVQMRVYADGLDNIIAAGCRASVDEYNDFVADLIRYT